MSESTVRLEPRDPVIVRDGRPFSSDPGAQAVSLDWPLPSTLSGALRTRIGNDNNFNWKNGGPDKARKISIQGPLMICSKDTDSDNNENWSVYLAAPADAVPYEKDDQKKLMTLSPYSIPESAGCNLPEGILPLHVGEEFKPIPGYSYWSLDDIVSWMCGTKTSLPTSFMSKLERETRTHVGVNADSGTSEEGKLFSTMSICFNDVHLTKEKVKSACVGMLAKIVADDNIKINAPGFIHFGGEKRVSRLADGNSLWPEFPKQYKSCNYDSRLKLLMATPGIFADGWKPGWLKDGSIPGIEGIKLKLVSAAINRKSPVSGWDMVTKKPKKVRYMAPAGCVYFFEVVEGKLTPEVMKKLWLSSICDDPQDNRDGFGIVIPGIWDYSTPQEDK